MNCQTRHGRFYDIDPDPNWGLLLTLLISEGEKDDCNDDPRSKTTNEHHLRSVDLLRHLKLDTK
jgi:hypothetical protein